jgi:sugar phosphate isomerase/epimerase
VEHPVEELATLLQRERLLLELLVFKITELRHLLSAGDARFLGWASEEVERAVDAVRQVELERAVLLQGIAGPDDDDESSTLRRLAETAEEPWGVVLNEHRIALLTLTSEVTNGLAAARRLADVGSSAVADLLDRVDGTVAETPLLTYGPDSAATKSGASPRVRATL